MLEAPIVFWEKQSKQYRKSSEQLIAVSIGVSLLILVCGWWLLHIGVQDLQKFSNTQIIPVYFIPIALISLLIYILRTVINIAVSSRHVSIEYAQKAALTGYYLSMIRDGKISDTEKQYVFPALFAKIDTGLSKSKSDSDMSEAIIAMLARSPGK